MYTAILFVLLALAVIIFLKGLKNKNKLLITFGVIIGVVSLAFFWFLGFWGEALWFEALGYSSRFWLEILYSLAFGAIGASTAIGSIYLLNMILPKSFKYAKWISILIATFSGAVWGYTNWDILLKFWDKVSTPLIDPIFGKSIGFYLFTLPFLDSLYNLFFIISFIGILTSVVVTFVGVNPQGIFFYIPPSASETTQKLHKSLYINFSVFIIVLAFGKYLDKFHLMYSSSGVVYGPGWTDATILIPAYNIIVLIMIILSITILIPALRNKFKTYSINSE